MKRLLNTLTVCGLLMKHRMPEHATSHERIGKSRHCPEIRSSTGFYA